MFIASSVQAFIGAFTEWSIGYDPYDTDLSGAVSADQTTLSAASGVITSGTDIVLFGVIGNTVGFSTCRYAFIHTSSLSIAIDDDLSFPSQDDGR